MTQTARERAETWLRKFNMKVGLLPEFKIELTDIYLAGYRAGLDEAAKDALDWSDSELRCMNDCCLMISERIKRLAGREDGA